MSRDLLLARRLVEAAASPDADRQSVEGAAFELAEIFGRIALPAGRGLPVASFGDMTADDLSPHAWLMLLESRRPEEPTIPAEILDALFVANADPVIRFRLVSGALHQDGPDKSLDWLIADGSEAVPLDRLPKSWPRDRLLALANMEGETGSRSGILTEMALYLLQDGSPLALALAASAVTPEQAWRGAAREAVRTVIRGTDPQLTGVGRYFRNAGI